MPASPSSVLIGDPSALLNLRKRDALYHALKKSILLAEFEPGVALTEQHIATGFGCSQGTVREALMRLEQDGLVARRSYQGTVVASTSLAEAAAMVTIRMKIESASVMHTAGKLAPEHKALLQQPLIGETRSSPGGLKKPKHRKILRLHFLLERLVGTRTRRRARVFSKANTT